MLGISITFLPFLELGALYYLIACEPLNPVQTSGLRRHHRREAVCCCVLDAVVHEGSLHRRMLDALMLQLSIHRKTIVCRYVLISSRSVFAFREKSIERQMLIRCDMYLRIIVHSKRRLSLRMLPCSGHRKVIYNCPGNNSEPFSS